METERYIAQASSFTNEDISTIITAGLVAFIIVMSIATILTIKEKINNKQKGIK
jgi:hypothetical protein